MPHKLQSVRQLRQLRHLVKQLSTVSFCSLAPTPYPYAYPCASGQFVRQKGKEWKGRKKRPAFEWQPQCLQLAAAATHCGGLSFVFCYACLGANEAAARRSCRRARGQWAETGLAAATVSCCLLHARVSLRYKDTFRVGYFLHLARCI